MLKTPVVLILFKRPGATDRVFKAIAEARPRKLFLIADGPRVNRPEESEACRAARSVVERVDWDCEVFKNYSEVNMGCGRRPASGIDWVFDHAEEAIILEDDCLPAPSFFQFCEELLERYREDRRVMHINGSTYRNYEFSAPESYFFSQFPGCWGWATWRRAWREFDFSVKLWPRFRATGWMNGFLGNDQAVKYWDALFEGAYENRPDLSYWDYQWLFACWSSSGLAIVPGSNLVSNIGGGPDATHTADHSLVNLPSGKMRFPLRHPPTVLPEWNLDREFLNKVLFPHIAEAATVPQTGIRQMLARITPEVIRNAFRAISKAGRPSATTASQRG